MAHIEFQPRTAVREEKRQAFEALGRSFCKTLAEPITNSDSSAKRKLKTLHSSGLIELMLAVPQANQMDTAALRAKLTGTRPKRTIIVEVVTAKSSGRPVGEITVIDQAEGMNSQTVREALDEIGGDKLGLSAGVAGRNLFGRGLSDVMRAHSEPVVQSYDGKQLTIARGGWDGRWTIKMDVFDGEEARANLKHTSLDPASTGTVVRFVISDKARAQGCRITDHPQILWRLANFYMLRLIAADPNVDLILRQHRAAGIIQNPVQFDFPVGQVIETVSRVFNPGKMGLKVAPLNIDFLVVRADSERGLRGPGLDRDARENGLLIVDELDSVYDLTFADPDYEKADFLARLYGIVRVNGLRQVLESYLNAEAPSSPLRTDRDGFNRDHEFGRALLEFIAEQLRPI